MEARNSDGLTESISWQGGVLNGVNDSAEVGFSWIPEHAGASELRSFVLSNPETPQVLSPFADSIQAGPVEADPF
jgi:hypothetical protein